MCVCVIKKRFCFGKIGIVDNNESAWNYLRRYVCQYYTHEMIHAVIHPSFIASPLILLHTLYAHKHTSLLTFSALSLSLSLSLSLCASQQQQQQQQHTHTHTPQSLHQTPLTPQSTPKHRNVSSHPLKHQKTASLLLSFIRTHPQERPTEQ